MAKKLNVKTVAKNSVGEVVKVATSKPIAFGAAIALFAKLLAVDGFIKVIESDEVGEFMELFRNGIYEELDKLSDEQKEKLADSIKLYLDEEKRERVMKQLREA